MPKRVLDVGQCNPDHATIRNFLTGNFDVEVERVHSADETTAALSNGSYDLVLINRKLDRDYSDGIEIIKSIKSEAKTADVPVMLVTNFPEHQEAAMAVGAARGFGKLEYELPETREKLAEFLA